MSQMQIAVPGLQPMPGPHLRFRGRRRRLGQDNPWKSVLRVTGQVLAPACPSSERNLVQRGLAGDADALDQLFSVHATRLYRTAFGILRNKEDAEDAVQDGLCMAFTKLRSFEGRASFSTWLTRIVINSALMLRRRRNAHPEPSLDDIFDDHSEYRPETLADERSNPEELCRSTELNALLEEQLRLLSPALQSALRIRELQGFSTAETASALGINQSTMKSRALRARRQLAIALQHSRQRPAN